MEICTATGCSREQLDAAVAAALGQEAQGLCAECAAKAVYPPPQPIAHENRPATAPLSPSVSAADRREAKAFFQGQTSDEEILAGRLGKPVPGGDEDLGDLRSLRQLDEQLAGQPDILDDVDRAIVDTALKLGRVKCPQIADVVGLHRSTVWRRVRRLRRRAPELNRFASTLLGTADPQSWELITAMFRTFAWLSSTETNNESQKPDDILSMDDYNSLSRMYRGGIAARRLLYPPTGLGVERRGDKAIITGSGPLPRLLQKAVRAGRAERIFDPPRCLACGRFVSRSTVGRPRKYCNERCRSRYRRRTQ